MSVIEEYRIDPTATKRTVYGSMMQNALTSNTDHVWLENTTLNEKYNVEAKNYPDENPHIGYFGFGVGGQYMGINSVGQEELMFYQHSPDHASLFYPIPFVLRRTDNDLDAVQRTDYALRTSMNVSGVNYYAYWLKRLDLSDTTTEAFIAEPDGSGGITETPFVPTSDVLNPTPEKPSTEVINLVTGEYLTTRSLYELKLSSWQLDELINAKQILTGTSTLNVNEIMIAHGVDKDVTSDVTYKEALGVQATAFFPKMIGINSYTGDDLLMEVDAGIDDPLTLALVNSGSGS